MKTLFRITILVIFSLTIFSCSYNKKQAQLKSSASEKSCIDQVLATDNSLGSIRNHNCETISMSKTIEIYTKGIGKINFDNCPSEFTKAFNSHKNAWIAMLKVTDKYPDLRGEMHDLFKIIETGEDKETFKTLLDAIWSTWADVEKSMKSD